MCQGVPSVQQSIRKDALLESFNEVIDTIFKVFIKFIFKRSHRLIFSCLHLF
jgi:hypothetical protein